MNNSEIIKVITEAIKVIEENRKAIDFAYNESWNSEQVDWCNNQYRANDEIQEKLSEVICELICRS